MESDGQGFIMGAEDTSTHAAPPAEASKSKRPQSSPAFNITDVDNSTTAPAMQEPLISPTSPKLSSQHPSLEWMEAEGLALHGSALVPCSRPLLHSTAGAALDSTTSLPDSTPRGTTSGVDGSAPLISPDSPVYTPMYPTELAARYADALDQGMESADGGDLDLPEAVAEDGGDGFGDSGGSNGFGFQASSRICTDRRASTRGFSDDSERPDADLQTLARALLRNQDRRSLDLDNEDVAADEILDEYLADSFSNEINGCKGVRDLRDAVDTVASASPRAIRFLRYLFDKAASGQAQLSADRYAKDRSRLHEAEERDRKASLELDQYDAYVNGIEVGSEPRKRRCDYGCYYDDPCVDFIYQRDEDGTPSHFIELPDGGVFFETIWTDIREEMMERGWIGQHDTAIPRRFAEMLCDNKTRDDILSELWQSGCGGQPTNRLLSREQVEFVDEMFAHVYDRLRTSRKGGLWWPKDRGIKPYWCNGCRVRPSARETADHEYRKDFLQRPFDLMGLPPELRTWIYELVLAPGEVNFRSCECSGQKPCGISPVLCPALLGVSSVVNEEAKGLLESNTLIVSAFPYRSDRRTLHSDRHRISLPDRLLSKVESFALVIELIPGCAGHHGGWVDYPEYEKHTHGWGRLKAMRKLKHLQIMAVERDDDPVTVEHWCDILKRILMRIPKDCQVEFGAVTEMQQSHVRNMVDTLRSTGYYMSSPENDVRETDVAIMKEAASRRPTIVDLRGAELGKGGSYGYRSDDDDDDRRRW